MQLLNSIRYQNTLTKRFHHGTLSQHPIEWVSNWRWKGGLTNISISISFRQVCSLSQLLVLSNQFQIIIVSHARSFCFCVGNKFPDSSVRLSCSLWSPTHHAPRETFTIFVKKHNVPENDHRQRCWWTCSTLPSRRHPPPLRDWPPSPLGSSAASALSS